MRRIHGVWLARHAHAVLFTGLVLACWLRASAANATSPPATTQTAAESDAGARPPDFELGLRAFSGDSDDIYVGALGFTFEALLMPSPHYGFGGSLSMVRIDNGGEPHYASSGTLQDGIRFLAFVEGDLLDFPITPYARLGLGGGPTNRWDGRGKKHGQLDFMAESSAGVVARLGPLVLRVFASPSLFGPDFVMVYGVGLGAHFGAVAGARSSGTIEP